MKYDVVIVGGGPGGLYAAQVAAKDGLKVLLVESKKEPARISRACAQIFYINKKTPSPRTGQIESHNDGYLEPVQAEIRDDGALWRFPDAGFNYHYRGPFQAYYHWIQLSPSGLMVERFPRHDKIWGFYFDKQYLCTQLVEEALKAGAEIRTATTGMAAENVPGGVKVRLSSGGKEETVEGRACLAADGLNSRIMDAMGLNAERPPLGPRMQMAFYIIEGLRGDLLQTSWWSWTIPSISRLWTIMMGMFGPGRHFIGTATTGAEKPLEAVDRFLKLPRWAPMFKDMRIVGQIGTASNLRRPVKNTVNGNVMLIGDAGAPAETWVQGALACAFKAVKGLQKEWGGGHGYEEYHQWWLKAFSFNRPDYFDVVSGAYPLMRLCEDDEIDFLWGLLQGQLGAPATMVGHHLDEIQRQRPALYEKLKGLKKA
jgi:flavin-dependent dehydrogenase